MNDGDDRARRRRGRAQRPPRRLEREQRTIAAMIAMYCRDHHSQEGADGRAEAAGGAPRTRVGQGTARAVERAGSDGGLCAACEELLAYARVRLEKCRYGADKPTCAKCTTHCYKPAMRERVRAVMRYSGPRMLRERPVLAVAHLADGRKTPGT